ncbi:MAG: thiamine biosynthesis protein ThiF [Promicromonosporaceae bacterium]|nr:thiamine biosynthesis protein ThiF [Promicromonosporaceae bacterium]
MASRDRNLLLRPGTVILQRDDDQVQVGLNPRWALCLGGLLPAEVSWLCELSTRAALGSGVGARRHGVSPERQAAIVEVLRRGEFPRRSGQGQARRPTLAVSPDDARSLGLLRADGDGRATLARRARSAVALSEAGRLGAAIALHLATAGVGRLVVSDRRLVGQPDLGDGGYAACHLGRPRLPCLQGLLSAQAPGVLVGGAGRPAMLVLVAGPAPSPAAYLGPQAAALPHLLVCLGEAEAAVGPLVIPGKTPCLNCRDLTLADADQRWPDVARQLRQAQWRGREETALSAVAAALAAAQVLAFLDGLTPATAGASLELALPQATPSLRRWAWHPRCGCRAPL